jgi:hypothetical protein
VATGIFTGTFYFNLYLEKFMRRALWSLEEKYLSSNISQNVLKQVGE